MLFIMRAPYRRAFCIRSSRLTRFTMYAMILIICVSVCVCVNTYIYDICIVTYKCYILAHLLYNLKNIDIYKHKYVEELLLCNITSTLFRARRHIPTFQYRNGYIYIRKIALHKPFYNKMLFITT